ncbi:hypothetical protein ACFO0M_11420 [Micromonospora mangrovi]|uniref:Uncharacterized protein n=2 Tax=Micromonospora TaxID=1873 RepID=A0AAU8HLR9_9ACTN
MGDAERRRRRLRHHGDTEQTARDADGVSATTAAVHDDEGVRPRGARRAEPEPEQPQVRRGGPAGDDGDRGLRGLVGSGSSQVGVTAALRARDAARPTEDDLAEAEARLVIVRRNWVPREDLPRSGR